MMQDLPEELVQSLRQRLLTRAAATRDAIDQFLAEPAEPLSGTIAESAHKLAGIAATLGYPDLGDAAAKVDMTTIGCPPDPQTIQVLGLLRSALGEALDRSA